MGEPATPTAQDRAETRELAARIVESVREDAVMPLELLAIPGRTRNSQVFMRDGVEQLAFRLAQEVELGHEEVMKALAELQGAHWEIDALKKERDDWKACAARTGTERRSDEMAAIHRADTLQRLLNEAIRIAEHALACEMDGYQIEAGNVRLDEMRKEAGLDV